MKPIIGSISSGTMRPEDLIPVFADTLEALMAQNEPNGAMSTDWRKSFKQLIAEARSIEFPEGYPSDADGIGDLVLSDLFDALDAHAPPYFYFGAHIGDGADFGFWLGEDWQRQMKDDGVLFVSDTGDFRIQGHTGLVAYVNDHGNLTLYRTRVELDEVWGVV